VNQVLVIDDSTTLHKLVEIAMRGTAVEVDCAATGNDGIARARATHPDVILLDFLLPDLSSVEICRQLSEDRSTAHVPVVLMSANSSAIFETFRLFPSVVDFIGKPFSAPEIRSRLESTLSSTGRRDRRSRSLRAGGEAMRPVTPAQIAAAAPRMIEVVAPRLGALVQDPGDTAAYAGRLLAPDVVAELLAVALDLAPDPEPVLASGELQLRGDLMTVPLLEVLRLLASAGSTGILTITLADTFRIYLRRGTLLMCSTTRFDGQALGDVSPEAIDPELLGRARAHQLAGGVPALVTLAHAGEVPLADLPARLHRLGERLLGELLGATAGRFSWQPNATLPEFVDALGRSLSVTAIAMGRQRGVAASAAPGVSLDEVYDRTTRFSAKLEGARLHGDEQRLLGLIDGRTPVAELAARAELSPDRAAALVDRLRSVDLIRSRRTSEAGSLTARRVVIVDRDGDGFVEPMRAYLAGRSEPLELVAVSDDTPELVAAMGRLRPRVVLFDAALLSASTVARELAPISRTARIRLVAVLAIPDRATSETWLLAGAHAVLVKPIHVNELERALELNPFEEPPWLSS
jgi:DNA-binding response OmpR family regulator